MGTANQKLSFFSKGELGSLKIKDIYDYLDFFVVGQEETKRALAQAFFLHLSKVMYHCASEDVSPMTKSNLLIMGPSGCGKTYLISHLRTILKLFNLDLFTINAKEITPTGYVGRDFEDYLQDFYNDCREKFVLENSVIFIDEIDKLAAQSITSKGNDFNREIQSSLLKCVEGHEYNVRSPFGGTDKISTKNILFILAGNFEAVREDRKRRQANPMGFLDKSDKSKKSHHQEIINAGVMVELIGRVSIISELHQLTEDQLLEALIKKKDSILKQYEKLFGLYEKKLKIDKEDLKAIAKRCVQNGTGARGLHTEIDNVLLQKMEKFDASKVYNKYFNYNTRKGQ